MTITLSLLRRIDKRLNAAESGNSTQIKLEHIRVNRSERGTGCIVGYGVRDCFVSHWFDNAEQMTQSLLYIKGLMKPGRTELDLYQFAFSVFNQSPPNGSDVVWLYFLNLSSLFQRITQIQSVKFWEPLLLGIKDRFRANAVPSTPPSTVVHGRFEVQVTRHSNMTMVYIGLNGCRIGPNYLTSANGAEFPVLAYKSDPAKDAPDNIYYPAWFRRTDLKWEESPKESSDRIDLKWIEPAREPCYLTNPADFNGCIVAILALFQKDTPYTVIGSTIYNCMLLCPRTTSNEELHHRNEGIHRAFLFQENPLLYAINSQSFVHDILAANVGLWGYTPMNIENDMECQVALNFNGSYDPETDDVYYNLQNAANPNPQLTLNVSYKGTVSNDEFIIIRSTKTEDAHSAASSEENSDQDI